MIDGAPGIGSVPALAHLDGGREHLLAEHLGAVSGLARQFADQFGAGAWAELAGLWHDFGKFSPAFQRRIRILNDPHRLEIAERVDHSTAGAVHAVDMLGAKGRLLAYLIAGHHAGLPDWSAETAGGASLKQRLQRRALLADAMAGAPPRALLDRPGKLPLPPSKKEVLHLWARFVFSALVDADFLDTEAFFQPGLPAERSNWPGIAELSDRLTAFLDAKAAAAEPTPVNAARTSLLADCRRAAVEPPGLFSITAPTGSGKTLSSLSFAMEHARRHGLRRVIYVIPYISITEQTADVFRKAFAPIEAVLEHHSAAQEEAGNIRQRLAAENWDAPVIVTTAVQFFESLFAARPSRCRKLHNIARSVVVLDEAQTLPVHLLDPLLAALDALIAHFGVTAVLCTATMPALDPKPTAAGGFRGIRGNNHGRREVVRDVGRLHGTLRRVRVQLPPSLTDSTTWEALAGELMRERQALCIVDRRRHAQDLWKLLPGALHLSAAMCGEHRAEVLRQIKDRLEAKDEVRVVSTQLIEAGVDVDFPIVFRALAGLDSLAQAAGRANREGRLPDMGELRVFVPPEMPFDPHLRRCLLKARALLDGHRDDPFHPAVFERYFEEIYWAVGPEGRDARKILPLLAPSPELGIEFRTAAERFRLIDEDSVQIVVAYGEGIRLIEELRASDPSRGLLRRAQRFSATLRRRDVEKLVASGAVEATSSGFFVQRDPSLYHSELGLVIEGAPAPEALIA